MYRNYIEELNLQPDEIIAYLRKSRSDDPLLSVEEVLAKHEAILDEWCERNIGDKIPESNKYREVVSGETIADRPEVQKVLKLIESPKIKAILIVEVQRLSRGDLEDAGRLMKLLRFTNTLVITPQWTFDLREEQNRDGFERELKRGNEFLEYTKKIMQRGTLLSVSQGNFVGNSAPYGYDKTWVMDGKRKCPSLSPNQEQVPIVQLIFDMYANQNLGVDTICHHLDKIGAAPLKGDHWSSATIRSMLENPVYIGKIRWNSRKTVTSVENGEITKTRPRAKANDILLYDGKHEAIISEETFYKAQERLGKNTRQKSNTKVRNPLAGLVHCQCGKAMTYRTYLKNGYQRCTPRLLCNNQTHCGTTSCTFDEIIYAVKEAIKNEIEDFEKVIKNEPSNSVTLQEKHIKTLMKKLQDLEAKELAQWEAQTDPDPSRRMPPEIFAKLNEKLIKDREETQLALANARETLPTAKKTREAIVRFHDALDTLDNPDASAEQKNRLLKACIQEIIYYRETSVRTVNPQSQAMWQKSNGWESSPIHLDIKFKV